MASTAKAPKRLTRRHLDVFVKVLRGEIIPQGTKDSGEAAALDNAVLETYAELVKTKRGEKFIGQAKQKKLNLMQEINSLSSVQLEPGIKRFS